MENETNYNSDEMISYVAERAKTDGRVPVYLSEELEDKISLEKLISEITDIYIDFLETDIVSYSNDDIVDYVVERTGYSFDIIELILWFEECYSMNNNLITCMLDCPNCGDVGGLHPKEIDGEPYNTNLQCPKCGNFFSYEEVDEFEELDEYDEMDVEFDETDDELDPQSPAML